MMQLSKQIPSKIAEKQKAKYNHSQIIEKFSRYLEWINFLVLFYWSTPDYGMTQDLLLSQGVRDWTQVSHRQDKCPTH